MIKKSKRIYLAGPMTGIEYFNFPTFDTYEQVFEGLGYEVFSPAAHDRTLLGRPMNWLPSVEASRGPWVSWALSASLKNELPTLRDMLGADLAWIAKNATHIAMLPGWEKSRGANAEWALAKALDLDIKYYPIDNEMVGAIRKESRLAA